MFDVVRCEFCCIQHILSLVGDLSRDVRVIQRHVGLGKGRGDHGGKQPPVTKKRVHFTPIESHSQPPPDAGKPDVGKPDVGKPDVGKPHGGKGEPANGGKQPHLVVGGDEAASLADTWPWLDDAGNDGADNDEAAGLAVTWPWLDDAGNDEADNDGADNDEADNAAGQAWMAGQCCWSRLVEAGIQMGWSSSAGWDGGDPAWWQNSSWKSAGHASSPHDEPSGGLLVEEDLP